MNFFITVFTPTYNRGYIIENLYYSLKRQTNQHFEWLVIDDGSNDNTKELFDQWSLENDFCIRYYKQPNGGKCRAINKALKLAKGDLFFTVDSDDYLTDDALEKINNWFNEIKDSDEIIGIVANRGYSQNETTNYIFSENYLDKSLLDMYSYHRNGHRVFDGERAFIFYTSFHKKYLYPEFQNENFMTEAITWNRMAHDGYLMRFYNDIIWIFEYQNDGLTNAGHRLFIDNPKGYGLWLKEKCYFETFNFFERFRMYYSYFSDLYDFYEEQEIKSFIKMPMFYYIMCVIIKKIKTKV